MDILSFQAIIVFGLVILISVALSQRRFRSVAMRLACFGLRFDFRGRG